MHLLLPIRIREDGVSRSGAAGRGGPLCIAFFAVIIAIAGCGHPGGNGEKPALEFDSVPATEAQVIAAVKEAETSKHLPAWITPNELVKSAEDDSSLWALPDCNPDYEVSSLTDINPCTVGAPAGAHTMVVIGDSNASMWARGLDYVGRRTDWRIIVLAKDNCGPATMTYYQWQLKRDLTECNAWQQWRMDQIKSLKPDMVVLSGWYDGDKGIAGPTRTFTPEMWRDALVATVQQIPSDAKTVLLGDIPHITEPAGECLAQNSGDISRCAQKASDVVPVYANDALRDAAAATGALYVDVTRWFCAQTCPAVIAGVVAYAGIYHTTHDYARYLSGVLEGALRPAMG
ncbi:SGNH hydrolase domain-containing protein [Mycobacterium sp. 360MFTsu5.1]|uniref:SGNH hydrolase domain-containing protein n=1 Tax=Mycobacterium sp. 360MFTsu5.1 TaxID=1172186 RepID=UPI0012DE90E5|nr:SGNH hydrolase domain-containing protein [Mycobacterium sp. 360MFTsu5.1]